MKAKEFRNVILFMGNRWDKDEAVKVFGPNMGAHFYGKWVDTRLRHNEALLRDERPIYASVA
jgi:hypothetical protein